MLEKVKFWDKEEARRRIDEVLAQAKAGVSQGISDPDGVFIIRFEPASNRERAGVVLARGGPDDD